ncbi:MAG: radical SAM protein, partial [Verrucomicrobiota bacterium]
MRELTLAQMMKADRYDGYAYSYPHKTSYREFESPVPLSDAWANEDRENLFLYTHLPFCEMRCGFCNLFTTVQPDGGLVGRTLEAIERQSEAVADAIRPNGVSQAAFGGGTPSFLSVEELNQLFDQLEKNWPVDWESIPVSFESSPGTLNPEKLSFLKEAGVDRLSLGVQSFLREDTIALRRPQRQEELNRACGEIKDAGFDVFNIDLIYGAEGQDSER